MRFRLTQTMIIAYVSVLILLSGTIGWYIATSQRTTADPVVLVPSQVVTRTQSRALDHPNGCYDCERQYADQNDAWQGQKTKCFSCEKSPHLGTPFDAHPIRYY